MTKSVRERSKDLLRAELAEAAYDYFAEHGFEQATVDEVAHGIGISRATFFRYFGSKEEAVIVAVHASPIDFASTLQGLERGDGESVWGTLRRMFAPSVADIEHRPDTLRARIRMINATPTLQGRLAERRVAQTAAVVVVLEVMVRDGAAARALAAVAFALFDVAWAEWSASSERAFSDILDGLFERFCPTEL